jgi:hypothetical protein
VSGSAAEIHALLAPGILMTVAGEQLGVSAAPICRHHEMPVDSPFTRLLHVCPPKANMGHSDPGFWIRKQGE